MSSTWLSYLGPIRVTGRKVRSNHYVLHLTVLPGADSSYRQKSEGQSLCPPLDCPTWGRFKLQARKWGAITASSTWLSYLGLIRVTGKEVRGNHCVLHLTVLLQLTRTWYLLGCIQKYQIKVHCVNCLTSNISKGTIDLWPLPWERLVYMSRESQYGSITDNNDNRINDNNDNRINDNHSE